MHRNFIKNNINIEIYHYEDMIKFMLIIFIYLKIINYERYNLLFPFYIIIYIKYLYIL